MKKRTSALLLALVMIFSLMAPMANAQESVAAAKEEVSKVTAFKLAE